MQINLKEKVVREKNKDGETIRVVSKKYAGNTPEGVKLKLELKGKEQELAPFGEELEIELN